MLFWFNGPNVEIFYRKRSIFMGTLPGLETLAKQCKGEHVHQHIESSTIVERTFGKTVSDFWLLSEEVLYTVGFSCYDGSGSSSFGQIGLIIFAINACPRMSVRK